MIFLSLKIKLYYDYVCPFSFLAGRAIDHAMKDKEIELDWMPYEVGAESLRLTYESWEKTVHPLASERGIIIKRPTIHPQPTTHLAFEGYYFAKENKKANEYNFKVFQAFFQEDKNISDIDVLANIVDDIGLDPHSFKKAVETRKYQHIHSQALEETRKERIQVAPTIEVGSTRLEDFHSIEEIEKLITQDHVKPKLQILSKGMSCGMDGC